MNGTLPPFGESIKWLLGLPSIASGILSTLIGLATWRYEWGSPFDAFVFTFLILLIAFFILLVIVFYRRVIIGEIELWAKRDLDKNGDIGNKSYAYDDIPINDYRNGRERNWAGIPHTSEKMAVDVAYEMLANNTSFSERNFTGKDKPYSSPQFRDVQAELIRRGWLMWKSEKDTRQGSELTESGKNFFYRLLDKHGLVEHSPALSESVTA